MKKRGRPREFDEEEVAAAIMALFWRQGFAATSLDDLAATTGLNRPSLYRAFGNKNDMYIMCLEKFGERMSDLLRGAFESADSVEIALTHLYRDIIDVYYSETEGKMGLGCLVFSNAVAEAPANEDVRRVVSDGLDEIEKSLRERFGRYAPKSDKEAVDAATELATSTFLGLGIRIRAGKSRKDVERMAQKSVSAISRLLD
eukprot:s1_g131.t1